MARAKDPKSRASPLRRVEARDVGYARSECAARNPYADACEKKMPVAFGQREETGGQRRDHHCRREDPAAAESIGPDAERRSEEHTSELQSLMRISYAVFCLKKKKHSTQVPKRNKNTNNDSSKKNEHYNN